MTNYEFMHAAEKKVSQCWATLMTRSGKAYPSPRLEFTLRGRAAGMHMGGSGIINLNMSFVAKNGEDMLNQTVPHETCHAWLTVTRDPSHVRGYNTIQNDAYAKLAGYRTRRTKRSPHGHTFMALLSSLGCATLRCHNYDTTELQMKGQRRWAYTCTGCGKKFNVTTCIHNKMLRGQKRWCTSCGEVKGVLVKA